MEYVCYISDDAILQVPHGVYAIVIRVLQNKLTFAPHHLAPRLPR